MYELSRLVLPADSYMDNENLFVNKLHESRYIYKFNTWMNIFPAKKYFQYCLLKDLFFEIKTDTDAEVSIYGFNHDEFCENDNKPICKLNIEANKETQIKINSAENYENLYFSLSADTESVNIEKAAWTTNTPPANSNKIAIINCTFKRENFVTQNVAKFNKFIKDNPVLSGRIKFYIVDNGKTLSAEIENENIKLFSNKNTGGAGGFTRGIIEAMESGEAFTRVLLMDDDVEIFPESFYRTLILADYLKPEFEKAFIHGAMLNLYNKNIFFESTARKTRDWCRSYHGVLDISQQYNIGKTNYIPSTMFEDEENKVSSAWWYCCFSLKSVKEKGLPLPVFFRCDDIEWSWRNFGEHHITMNGICVWHAPFEWRVSKPVQYYFSKRNISMINILYTKNYKKTLIKMLKKDFKYLLKIFDYTSCNIYLRMMEDLSKASAVYRRDPEEVLKELMAYTKDDLIEDTIDAKTFDKISSQYKLHKKLKKDYRHKICYFKKKLWEITLQGRLVPTFLWKKKKNLWVSAPSDEFLFVQTVHVLNLATHKEEIRTYDFRKIKFLKGQFNKLLKNIDTNYEKLREDFSNAKSEFVTEKFWKEYLCI